MNKQHIIVLALFFIVFNSACMERDLELVDIKLADGTLPIETWKVSELNLKKESNVVALPNILKREMQLVSNALNVHPGVGFKAYFDLLPQESRNVLITAVGRRDSSGKDKLNSAYLTEQLVKAYPFPYTVHKHIEVYLEDEKNNIRKYFRKKIVIDNTVKINWRVLDQSLYCVLRDVFHPTQHMIDDWRSYNGFGDAIPLFINGELYATYSTAFLNKNNKREFRITDIKPLGGWMDRLKNKLSESCLLWIIDHDKQHAVSTLIKHKSPIMGCFFSSTGTGIEHAVTYADNDICFSEITLLDDGLPYVETISIDSPAKIITAAFDFESNQLVTGAYEGYENVMRWWGMDGKENRKLRYSCDAAGFLKQMVITEGSHNIFVYKLGGEFKVRYRGEFINYDTLLIENGGTACLYVFDAREEKPAGEKKVYTHVYSPDGKFLIDVVNKDKFWVQIQIWDVATRKYLGGLKELYKNFSGVGFNHDGTNLIILRFGGWDYKVPLYSVEDREKMDKLEPDLSLGQLVLLRRLVKSCNNGSVNLHKKDPAYVLLQKLSTESAGALLIRKYLPIKKEEKKWIFW